MTLFLSGRKIFVASVPPPRTAALKGAHERSACGVTEYEREGKNSLMIKNIVFDMGNVLLQFTPRLFIQRLGFFGEDEELLMNQVFRSLEWARMDRGSLTESQAAESICSRLPERFHPAVHSLTDQWDRPIVPVEGMYELIEELKQAGYGIYLLSNASFRQHDYWPLIPCSRFFDGTLISADVGLVKPQTEIYDRLFHDFDLKPEECFFVDDSPANIEGAFCCGMPGAVFNNDVPALRRAMAMEGIWVRQ